MTESSDASHPEVDTTRQPASGEPSDALGDLDPRIPPASFITTVTVLASQAMTAMGRVPDPMQKPPIRPRMARYFIDMVSILEEKTKGNLSKDEAQAIESILYDLRMTYVSITKK